MVGSGHGRSPGARRQRSHECGYQPPDASRARPQRWEGQHLLHHLRRDPALDVVRLMTTANKAYGRSSMDGVRSELCRRQAERLGLPLDMVVVDSAAGTTATAQPCSKPLRCT